MTPRPFLRYMGRGIEPNKALSPALAAIQYE